MVREVLIVLVVGCVLFSSMGIADGANFDFIKGKVKILDVKPENPEVSINLDESFNVTVTLKNDGWFLKNVYVRIDLVDSLTGLVRKEIGSSSMYERIRKGETELTISCTVGESDVEWYKSYGIVATVFIKIGPRLFVSDKSTPQGIEISDFSLEEIIEDMKIRITDFKISAIKEKTIKTEVTVKNYGDISVTICIRIDMVKPSSLGIPGIEGMGTLSEEIGKTKNNEVLKPGKEKNFTIDCEIPKANNKASFYIQAILFAFINDQKVKVDTTTLRSVELPWGTRVKLGLSNSIGGIASLIATIVLTVALCALAVRVIWRRELNILKMLRENKNTPKR